MCIRDRPAGALRCWLRGLLRARYEQRRFREAAAKGPAASTCSAKVVPTAGEDGEEQEKACGGGVSDVETEEDEGDRQLRFGVIGAGGAQDVRIDGRKRLTPLEPNKEIL